MNDDTVVGATIHFSGIVQGVGFRPTVYRIAKRYGLKGHVKNTDIGVFIEVEGKRSSINNFYHNIINNPPELAEITDSSIDFHEPLNFKSFVIIDSEDGTGFSPIAPDIATCNDCLQDIFDKSDRRYHYPFTNCTNCGPRFTITKAIPYDRKNTTMSGFIMCEQCQREYDSPDDRRYHAQPNACGLCGPHVNLYSRGGSEISGDPIAGCIELLNSGKIVAIKGIGGYHLACDPTNHEAVLKLRKRKRRPGKPFALMVKNLEIAKKYCYVNEIEGELLLSPERPIVLVPKRVLQQSISPMVAPDTNFLGLMLPYTPLHHIILEEITHQERGGILVMTSANFSEEPLFFRDKDASEGLHNIADAFLVHDREIERPCDDSVIRVVENTIIPVRRSRGYVPRGIAIGISNHNVFSAGASEKNTFCVFRDQKAYVSHYIGDLVNEPSIDAYTRGIDDFIDIFRINPEVVACDLHPDYHSTIYAEELAKRWGVTIYRIQHHYAHIASVLAEYGIEGPVIGIAFDGTGYGEDGNIWGGEFLVADGKEYERVGHYAYVPMPGGERSIIEIDRMAISYLLMAYGDSAHIPDFPFIDNKEAERLTIFEKILEKHINSPLTSSCGRLFDAVSALIGLCSTPTYDAQGAILLEREAGDFDSSLAPYQYSIDKDNRIHFDQMIREIVNDKIQGIQNGIIAGRFHMTIITSAVELCERIRNNTGIGAVSLSGGVFQNRIVFKGLFHKLMERGFSTKINTLLPPNDGCISLGQGLVALNRLKEGIKTINR
ncbi:MAG: carbamoyltransferase HypF [Spirochaetota bacterium]|nr:MAG: carbamoyltransferase HypF [Spirochaetota bacterium]